MIKSMLNLYTRVLSKTVKRTVHTSVYCRPRYFSTNISKVHNYIYIYMVAKGDWDFRISHLVKEADRSDI